MCADWRFSDFRCIPPASRRANAASICLRFGFRLLFLQGTRDTLAMLDQIEPLCGALGANATLKLFADADHSFHVPARSGRKDAQVLDEVLDTLVAWINQVLRPETASETQ